MHVENQITVSSVCVRACSGRHGRCRKGRSRDVLLHAVEDAVVHTYIERLLQLRR